MNSVSLCFFEFRSVELVSFFTMRFQVLGDEHTNRHSTRSTFFFRRTEGKNM
jgi:hypothetical protein